MVYYILQQNAEKFNSMPSQELAETAPQANCQSVHLYGVWSLDVTDKKKKKRIKMNLRNWKYSIEKDY